MAFIKGEGTIGFLIVSIIAILLGILTAISGGLVLYGGNEYQKAAGDYVPFVVWFNFVAGFAYLIAGVGLLFHRVWGVWLSALIALATLMTFAMLGLHISAGGSYELRTIAAMTLRSVVWIAIAVFGYWKIILRA